MSNDWETLLFGNEAITAAFIEAASMIPLHVRGTELEGIIRIKIRGLRWHRQLLLESTSTLGFGQCLQTSPTST